MNPSPLKLNANVFGEDAADEELYDIVDREIQPQPLEMFSPDSIASPPADVVLESLEGENQGNSCERGKKNLSKQQKIEIQSSTIGNNWPRDCLGGRSRSRSPPRSDYEDSQGATIRSHTKANKIEGPSHSDWTSSRNRIPSDHILHCLTIGQANLTLDRAGADTRLAQIEVASQAQFDALHEASIKDANQLRI